MESIKYYDLTLSQDVMYFALKYSPKKSVVNIGAAFVVLPAGAGHAVFFCVLHQGVAVFHILCYTVHEA